MEPTLMVDAQALKMLIKESLREVLREERLNLCQLLMPFVTDEEQAEIELSLGSPDSYDPKDFVNLTDWMRHGGSI